ncbi:hypothetical protein GGR58DRAFT_208264 [Xylaria digitata]|nr:hypothetical protein GGR58DRAFT_208264 [Xylaria digitata]
MTRVTDMPCEVIVSVFKQLDNIKFLPPCLLTCRHFYYSYTEIPRSGIEILGRQVGPALLPYSIATEEASQSLPACLSTTELIVALQNKSDTLIDRLRDYPLIALVRLGHMHDLVEKYAKLYASEASGYINKPSLQPHGRIPSDDAPPLSSTEQLRFYRAFYRFELYTRLLRGNNAQLGQEIDMFFSGHCPYENEQLACVYDFLGRNMSLESFVEGLPLASELETRGMNYWTSLLSVLKQRCVNANDIRNYDNSG